MRLRTSLLVGYGYLVVLLLVSSASAIVGFHSLGKGIESILRDNFASIRAVVDMTEAIERHDSATLGKLIDRDQDPAVATRAEQRFEASLKRAWANVTIEKERPLLHEIQAEYQAYLRARRDLLADPPADLLTAYELRIYPAFVRVKASLTALLELNHQAMREAEGAARRSAVSSGVWLGVLVLVALFSLVALSRRLHQRLLVRLDELLAATEAIAEGDSQRRLPIAAPDELGRLAARLNEALDAHQKLQAAAAGRIAREQRQVLALFDALGPGRVLLDEGGAVLLEGTDPADARLVEAAAAWIRTRADGPAAPDGPVPIEVGEATAWLRRLAARDDRPVGWLVSLEGPTGQATSS